MKYRSLDQRLERLKGSASPPVEEMESAGDRVWRNVSSDAVSRPLPDTTPVCFRRPLPVSMLAAAAAVAILVMSVVFLQNGVRREQVAAVIAGGSVSRLVAGKEESLRQGQGIEIGETLRSASDEGGVFALSDGSQIEMRAKSELLLERAEDGVRVRLKNGDILVSAAKQRKGHLYVQTKDVTVSVIGTVFRVNAEAEGSSVSVIEGEVHVQQGNIETKLRPGEHVSTVSKPEPRALKEEIAWSQKLEEHLALLQVELQQLQFTISTTISPITGQVTMNLEGPKRRFEEAAIRPCTPEQQRAPDLAAGARGGGGGTPRTIRITPGRFDARCMTVKALIGVAHRPLLEAGTSLFAPRGENDGFEMGRTFSFGVDGSPRSDDTSLRGGPDWMFTEGYTIEAITDGSTTSAMMQHAMLWDLLERRFHLKVHTETEQVPALALLIAPGGLKIKPFQDGDCSKVKVDFPSPTKPWCGSGGRFNWNGPNIRAEFSQTTLAGLTIALGGLGAPIIDRTGNTDLFAITFEYGPDEETPRALRQCQEILQTRPERAPNCADRPTAPSIHTALSNLGLKVEPTKAPREFIVVDRVERPSPN